MGRPSSSQLDDAALTGVSMQELRRPLRDARRRTVRGEPGLGVPREVLGLLESLRLRGDEETREWVEALACLLVSGAMSERLLHPRHGAIPKFVGDVQRQVESFERYIR